MTVSEAIELVGKMIRGYANKGQADKAYIGAIAELLMQYPRSVAVACAHPFRGVVKDTRFMPTPADVISFCDKRAHPMFEERDRELRIDRQLEARVAWQDEKTPEPLKENGQHWLDRTDPKYRELNGIHEQKND